MWRDYSALGADSYGFKKYYVPELLSVVYMSRRLIHLPLKKKKEWVWDVSLFLLYLCNCLDLMLMNKQSNWFWFSICVLRLVTRVLFVHKQERITITTYYSFISTIRLQTSSQRKWTLVVILVVITLTG